MTRDKVSGRGSGSGDLPRHPRAYADDLPASGAWQLGDPVGGRCFVDVAHGRPFVLEGGGVQKLQQKFLKIYLKIWMVQ